MALVFMLFCFYTLIKKYKTITRNQRLFISVWLFIAIIGLVIYTNFLKGYGWEYGIAGADMKNYFYAAQKLNDGANWSDLKSISALYFGELKYGTFMYFIFSQFIAILLWLPIFGIQASLYFIYISFLLICCISSIDLATFFSDESNTNLNTSYILVTLTCVGLMFAAYRLLRDVLLFFFIVKAFLYIKKDKEHNKICISLIIMGLCSIIRSYSLLLILPYFIYHYFDKRVARISIVLLPIVLVSFSGILVFVQEHFIMSWDISFVETSEVVHYVLFPNIYSQTQLIVNWDKYPHYSNYLAGCNLPGMYYLMAVWNFFILPLSIIGVIHNFWKKFDSHLVWGVAILNICFIYSMLYSNDSGLETRHKIMILIPLVYFSSNGFAYLKKYHFYDRRFTFGVVYNLLILLFLLGMIILCV